MGDDPFTELVGQQGPIRLFRLQIRQGRLAHAYLLVGESGLGKTSLARAFARALLPETELSRHPDYWEDVRDDHLALDEVRLIPSRAPLHHQHTLQQFINWKPSLGRHRVALIGNLQRTREDLQNLILKTLEEPLEGRVIILTSPSLSPFTVLPTLVSRCQQVSCHPVPDAAVLGLLRSRGADATTAERIAAMAGGRPGWAARALEEPSLWQEQARWEERLDHVFGAPAHLSLALAAEVEGLSQAWRAQGKEQSPAAEDPKYVALRGFQLALRRLMGTSGAPASARFARLLEASYETLGHLEQNVSTRLALEVFLLKCRRVS